jgi:cyclophilin family peptidyl-prolyl cis-trans isomerase
MAMARWKKRGLVAAMLAGWALVGCNNGAPTPADPSPDAKPAGDKKADPAPVAFSGDRLHQPFDVAAREGDNPPAGVNRPADRVKDAPAYLVLSDVKTQWNEVRFTTADGKPIAYTAVLDTDQGQIEIELRPDVVPNHVRNFVALARAHYYDGLHFDRVHHEKAPDGSPPLDYIEAGCPLGGADPEDGSIGYWIKAEPAEALKHEAGAVGASRGFDPDSAACKFYVNLSDAPLMDGHYTVFGKVTKGLDVARTIFSMPTIVDDADPPGHHRPEKPVTIRSVTIVTH